MHTTKQCNKCKRELGINNFYKNRRVKSGYGGLCKECTDKNHQNWLERHHSEYREMHRKYSAKYRDRHPIRYHLSLIKRRGCTLAYEDFEKWYLSQPKKCSYCDIPEEIIKKIRWGYDRAWGHKPNRLFMTIDKKDSAIGYVLGNMCFGCSVCNGLKSNFFTETEFKEIANKYIKPRWEKLIK